MASDKPSTLQPLSSSQRELLTEALEAYETGLLLSAEANEYLANRGIDEATAGSFRLGVVDEPLPGHEKLRGMLAIPYLDRDDQPLSIRFRCFQDHNHRDLHHGKYMSAEHDPGRMYNVRAIHRATGAAIHICEGELDAVILAQLGLDAVAMPGADTWRPHHKRMLAGFSRVWVWSDPDEAGQKLANAITQSLRQAKVVRLRDGDVSDNHLKYGGDALLELIKEKAK